MKGCLNNEMFKIAQLKVTFSTAGKLSIVGDKVVLSGLKGMSGLVVFYYVTDGKYESEPGRVAVYLERARELPSAVGDTAVLNLASGEVIIDVLANDSYSGWTPVISNISDVTLDGNKCEGVRLSVDWAGSRPRIRVDSTVAEVLTSGDQIKFNYTLSTQEDGSISKLAQVTVTVIGAATAGDNEGLIYVHRKPVAGFLPVLQRAGDKIVGVTMVTTDEFSYDLDHISENNKNSLKGICNWNWSIQENLSGYFETFSVQGGWGSTLSDIRLENIRAAQDRLQESIDRGMAASGILLRLSVKDVDGAWSDPFSVLVTDKKLPPVAKFELPVSTFYIAETGSSFGSDFKVFDQSYSPSGFDIVQHTWKFTNNKGISETIITSNPESRVVELVY